MYVTTLYIKLTINPYHYILRYQGRIQDFLKEGANQAERTDVQSQKSVKELPNMHTSAKLDKLARHNWLFDCFNRMLDCSIRVSRSFCNLGGSALQAFGREWALLNWFSFARCSYKGNWPKADTN